MNKQKLRRLTMAALCGAVAFVLNVPMSFFEKKLFRPSPGGGVRYGVEPVPTAGNDASKLLNIARLASLSIEAACNIIVIKTMPGLAHAVGSFADKLEEQGLVGSIAGNDTILLIIKDSASAQALCRDLRELLFGGKDAGEKRAAGAAD